MISGLAWIVAVTLGLVGGGFIFHFPGSYGEPGWNVGAAIFGFVLGALNGLVVGVLAWAALRLPRRTGKSLLGAMVLIVGGTHAFNDGSSTQAPFLLMQALAGLIAAGTPAWILRDAGLRCWRSSGSPGRSVSSPGDGRVTSSACR